MSDIIYVTVSQPTIEVIEVSVSNTQGPQGTQGLQGLQGLQGIQGVIGPQGVIGVTGSASVVPGPQGIQGDIGLTGPTGAASTVSGPQGIQGATGIQGIQGIQGATGATSGTVITSTIVSTNYTFVLTDAGACVESSAATGIAFTIPPNSSVAFPLGTVIEVFQYGAGQITITPGSGVTIISDGAKTKTAALYATIGLRQRVANQWVISGDLA